MSAEPTVPEPSTPEPPPDHLLDAEAELEAAEAALVPLCQHSTDANEGERMALWSVRNALGSVRAILAERTYLRSLDPRKPGLPPYQEAKRG